MMEPTLTHPSHALIGHHWALEQLRSAQMHGRVRHAYLFLGAESVGKETVATAFAMLMNCQQPALEDRPCGVCSACRRIVSGNHPDLVYAQADETTGALKIEEIRRVIGQLALKPFEARHRIALVRDFHMARGQAQDALLKTLEEPPAGAMILLLSHSADAILPTITSRSQLVQLRPVPADEIAHGLVNHYGADAQHARLLAGLCGGRVGWAIRALHDPATLEARRAGLDRLETILAANRAGRFAAAESLSKDKASLIDLLELWLTYWRDLLLLTENSALPIANIDREATLRSLAYATPAEDVVQALRATRTTLTTLTTTNAGVRLALDILMLDYPGLR